MKDEIYGSAFASAVYISSVIKMPKDKKVYVIGMAGLEEELEEEGIAHIGGTVSPATASPPSESTLKRIGDLAGSRGQHPRELLPS